MTDDAVKTAAGLLIEFGDVESAERAAGARIQTACNAGDRRFWEGVRRLLAAHEDARNGEAQAMRDG